MLRTGGTRWENIGGLFENGLQESQSSTPESLLLLVGNTLTLLGQIHRAVMDRSTDIMAAEKPQLLEQVLSYIEKNLSVKIALADVAHQFFVSESTVSQLFRKKMGVSFYRCVTQRRLIAAKALITEGNPLEQVAEKTGFGDYSAFYRAFKQEYGISPRQYRNLQGK
jgi:AraC-like DNA-binding protein